MNNLFLFFIFLCVYGCTQSKYTEQEIEKFKSDFIQHVQEKDDYFANNENSPIRPEERKDFTGLHYFEYNPDFRFEGPLNIYQEPDSLIIYGSKGDERPSIKFGYFDFDLYGKKYRLEIIKILRSDPEYEKYLFLGFTDATTNKETYGAGRYIDLTENEENFYIIDFNYAYNPYCAYNEKYSCAVPVQENHLQARIEAGEMKYHD